MNQEIGPPQEPITSFIHFLNPGYKTLTVLREKHPSGTRAGAAHASASAGAAKRAQRVRRRKPGWYVWGICTSSSADKAK